MTNEVITLRISEISLPDRVKKHLGISNEGNIKIEFLPNRHVELYSTTESAPISLRSLRLFSMEEQLDILRRRIAFHEYENDKEAEAFITSVCCSINDAPVLYEQLRCIILVSGSGTSDTASIKRSNSAED